MSGWGPDRSLGEAESRTASTAFIPRSQIVGSLSVTKQFNGFQENAGAPPIPKIMMVAPFMVEDTAEGSSMEPGIIVRFSVGTGALEGLLLGGLRRAESLAGVRTRQRQA